MRTWLALALVLSGCERSPHERAADPGAAAVRTAPRAPTAVQGKELFDHPEWIGTVVHVDLDAPMRDDEHSSLAAPGELDVEIADVGPKRLALARADHAPITMAGTVAPVHVVATLREAPHGLRLEATAIEHFARPAPIAIAQPGDILTDPDRFSGALVTFEADWHVGFEMSLVDDGVWMDFFPGVKQICEPPPPADDALRESHTYRVRVIGVAHTAGHYGHLGRAAGEVLATEVIYLDPSRPECR